jgi:hypothetical protein
MESSAIFAEERTLFLKDWLSSRILGSGKDFGLFLNAEGTI